MGGRRVRVFHHLRSPHAEPALAFGVVLALTLVLAAAIVLLVAR